MAVIASNCYPANKGLRCHNCNKAKPAFQCKTSTIDDKLWYDQQWYRLMSLLAIGMNKITYNNMT